MKRGLSILADPMIHLLGLAVVIAMIAMAR